MNPSEVLRLRARQLRDDAAMSVRIADEARAEMERHEAAIAAYEAKAVEMEAAADRLEKA